MNEALDLYEHEDKVMHIGSYLTLYQFIAKPYQRLSLSRFMSCWGWATWKTSWERANLE